MGWYYSNALHSLGIDGERSGYDYEYLEAIRQYADFEYEYVSGSFAQCQEWLKDGTIDLMGVVNKTPETQEIFDFSRVPQGTEYSNLYVLPENTEYYYDGFEDFGDIMIGMEESTHQLELLEKLAKEKNFTFQKRMYSTVSAATIALENGTVDALLARSVDDVPAYKLIARFSPTQFYFAVKKGNSKLLNKIDSAMDELLTYNPHFSNNLYDKYYGKSDTESMSFTKEELAYINANPDIRIGYRNSRKPIEYYETSKKLYSGANTQVIGLVKQNTSLNIAPLKYSNAEDFLAQITSQDNHNIITILPYDFNIAEDMNMKLTQPFFTTTVLKITKSNQASPKTACLIKDSSISKKVEKFYPDIDIVYCDDAPSCLDLVKNNSVDVAFLNSIEGEYYTSSPEYEDLVYDTESLFNQSFSIGVPINTDPSLFSVLSKSLSGISKEEINSIFSESASRDQPLTLKNLIKANPIQSILIASGFFIFVIVMVFTFTMKEIKNKDNLLLQFNRYNELIEMVGEVIFEYDYEEDKIIFKNMPSYIILISG